MKQNPDFVMCDVAGNHVLMPIGRSAINLDGMITLNDIGVFIWNNLSQDISYSALLESIVSNYDVEKETADTDLNTFLTVLKDVNAIIE